MAHTGWILILIKQKYLMGLEQSQPLEKKPSKSKSSLTKKSLKNDDVSDFVNEISALSCLQSTSQSSYDYIFRKLKFTGHFSPLPKCRAINRQGSPIFVCYDCSLNDQAYLCEPCFEKGNHENHRFNVFPNNNNFRITFCRCGDEQFMKKKTICQTHVEAPKITYPNVDAKEMALFHSYFNQVFVVLHSLKEKNRHGTLLNAILYYFQEYSSQNLYYSKIIAQFLLAKNESSPEMSNLLYLLKINNFTNYVQSTFLRNLNLLPEYKTPILKIMIEHQSSNQDYCEIILNFAGKIEILNDLAKNDGITPTHERYLNTVISNGCDATEIWKCVVNKKLIVKLHNNQQIMLTLLTTFKKDEKYIANILQQLLQSQPSTSKSYVLACLMILEPTFFLGGKKPKSKSLQKLDKKFYDYFSKIFLPLNTYQRYDNLHADLLILLPYFSFGESVINKFWQQAETRLDVIVLNKERSVIRQASNTYLNLITTFLDEFLLWEHNLLKKANQFKLEEYVKDKKFVEKVLMEVFDKQPKIFRPQMLNYLDLYTQKNRDIAKDIMKKNLRYNTRKQKYYNISKKMLNNPYNNRELNVGCPLKLSEWQQKVSSSFFNSTFYKIVPKLIKFAQRGLMEDIEMVQTVSYISSVLSILKKSQKASLKELTRNFIKQIPDVREDVYYILAGIRDRLELDIDEIEEKGQKGKKKVKLDLITEIRDKKFREMKEKQERIRKKWLHDAEKAESDHEEQFEEDICHICKQKEDEKRRFVYPCNFTRNNVISSLLRSEVTDLDINICLHKVHEGCFEKNQRKGQCQICKFPINCYIPEKPLEEESFTKNWLRTFERIVTTINLESGKSFNSDWATIFMTYLIFSRSFKVLLKNSQIQDAQRKTTDELIIRHYKSQYQKWPQLTKQALKKAEKTVKGQVRRESNTKKAVKSLVMDLVFQQITEEPFKNVKRILKKFREMINIIGNDNSQKINECFHWSRDNQEVLEVFETNIAEEVDEDLFKIKSFPKTAKQYLTVTSIKCPMCNKYQPSSWICLFCEKKSCGNCINTRFHCERDHRGCGVILNINDARYQLYHQNRMIESDSLYRNEYSEGWTRNVDPEGWVSCSQQIETFFDKILHSHSPYKIKNQADDNSEQGDNRQMEERDDYEDNNDYEQDNMEEEEQQEDD